MRREQNLNHAAVGLCALLYACAQAPAESPSAEALSTKELVQELEGRGQAHAVPFARFDALPAGVATDGGIAFVGSPLEGRLLALSMRSGRVVGELPAPEEGFILPFNMHIVDDHTLAVLDRLRRP